MLKQTSLIGLSLASIWLPLSVLVSAQAAKMQAYLATTTIWETVWTVCSDDENTASDFSSSSSLTVCTSCLPLSHRPFDVDIKQDEDTGSLGPPSSLPTSADQDQSTSGQSTTTFSLSSSSLSIVIPGVLDGVLTGVTVAPPSSPTSCYALPTPTSELELVAFSTNTDQAGLPGGAGGGVGTGRGNNDGPLFMYFGDDATSPEYVGTLMGGSSAILDLSGVSSAAGQVAMVLGDGSSVVFDKDGMQFFDAARDSVSSVTIERFWDQAVSIAESPPDTATAEGSASTATTASCSEPPSSTTSSNTPARKDLVILPRRPKHRAIEPSSQETNFIVQVRVNRTLNRLLRSPKLAFGPSGCTFSTRRNVTANHNQTFIDLRWTCQHPGKQSAEKKCEDSLNSWLGGPPPVSPSPSTSSSSVTSSSTGPLTSPKKQRTDLLNFLSPVVSGAGSQLSSLVSPGLVNSTLLQQGMAFLGNANQVISSAVSLGADSLCHVLHALDEYELVFSDPALPSPHTIGAYVSPPADVISKDLVPPATSPSREPPRECQPGATGFPKARETVFTPLIFTGLPGLGGLIPIGEVSKTSASASPLNSDTASMTNVEVTSSKGDEISTTGDMPMVTQVTRVNDKTIDEEGSSRTPILTLTTSATTDVTWPDVTANDMLTWTGTLTPLATSLFVSSHQTEEDASWSDSASSPSSAHTSSPSLSLTMASSPLTTTPAPLVVGGAIKGSAAAFPGEPMSMLSLFSWQSSSMASSLLAHKPSSADASPAFPETDPSSIFVAWSNPPLGLSTAQISGSVSSETSDQTLTTTGSLSMSLGFEGFSIEAPPVDSETGLATLPEILPTEPIWTSSSQKVALSPASAASTTSSDSLTSRSILSGESPSNSPSRPQASAASIQAPDVSSSSAILDFSPKTLTIGANGTSETIVVVAVETATVFPSHVRAVVAEA